MSNNFKVSLVQRDKRLLNNLWFSEDQENIRDNQNSCYAELKRQALINGIDISTEDINIPYFSSVVIFIDIPQKKYIKNRSQIWYLILSEPPSVYKRNSQQQFHSEYDRIFTWNDDLVDNKKYYLLRFAYDLHCKENKKNFEVQYSILYYSQIF